jgi:hypothetical protein
MENISGKSRVRFPGTFSCITIGLAVSVSPCFAQEDRNAPQELQRLQQAQRILGPCDSLDPKICLDIYQRRMEQLPERKPDPGWLSRDYGQAMVGKWLSPPFNPPKELGTRIR